MNNKTEPQPTRVQTASNEYEIKMNDMGIIGSVVHSEQLSPSPKRVVSTT